MILKNEDCSKITYYGDGIIKDNDLSNIESYTTNLNYNGTNYTKKIDINVLTNENDTYTLPCGVTKVTECESTVVCTSNPVLDPIYADEITVYNAPTINGFGWYPSAKEERIEIQLSSSSAFRSLSISNSTVLSTADNLKYSSDYLNVNADETPSYNAKKLEEDLQLALFNGVNSAIVNVRYDNNLKSFFITLDFLQLNFPTTSLNIVITEYNFNTLTTNTITTLYAPTVNKNYDKDRIYFKITSLDASNIINSYWETEDEGVLTSTFINEKNYFAYYKDLSLVSNHNIYYVVNTLQGQTIKYKYTVSFDNTNLLTSITYINSFNIQGIQEDQISTSFGTGVQIGDTILSCNVSSNENEDCVDKWEFVSGYFNDECDNNTQFADGIYTLTTTIKYNDGSCDIYKECIFLGCNIQCQLVEYLASNPKRTDLVAIMMALNNFNNCNLSCNELINLYEYLKEQLEYGTDTTNTTDCGCV